MCTGSVICWRLHEFMSEGAKIDEYEYEAKETRNERQKTSRK
jgi:hypothetical protein